MAMGIQVKSVYAERLDDIQRQVHALALKPKGFKKQGRTFCRKTADGLVQVVNFQMGGLGDNEKFWVNLGVRVSECCEMTQGAVGEKEFYKEYECNIRSRLNKFTSLKPYKGYADRYFSLIREDTSKVVDEIIMLLKNYAMPFFDDFDSREKVLANREKYLSVTSPFNNNWHMEAAIICVHLGDVAGATESMNMAYARSTLAAHREYLETVADKLGLVLSPAPPIQHAATAATGQRNRRPVLEALRRLVGRKHADPDTVPQAQR